MDSSRVYIDEERIKQAREIQKEKRENEKHYIQYRATRVGGDPANDMFLFSKLDKVLRELSDSGWCIDRIDKHTVNRAWDRIEGRYVPYDEYIIIYHGEVEKE